MGKKSNDRSKRQTDDDVRFILRKAGQIQDWEYRAGRALSRLRGLQADASRVCAAYERWLAKGNAEFGPNCPIRTVTGYAVWALPEGDDSTDARWLRKRDAFLQAMVDVAMRAHHTYLDVIMETDRGGAFYQLEIDAEAFRMGLVHDLDPAKAFECMDAAVRLYLSRAGQQVAQRPPISSEDLHQIFREAMTDATAGFATHMSEKMGVDVTPVRLGNHSV